MKKIVICLLAVVIFTSTLLTGCGGEVPASSSKSASADLDASGESAPTLSGDTVVVRVGHAFQPTHPISIELDNLAARIEQNSNGLVKVEVHGAGVLGNNEQMAQQVLAGSLDAMIAGALDNFSSYDSRADVEDLPFLFRSEAEAHAALDGEYGQLIRSDVLAPVGLYVISFWENGLRHMTNNKHPLYTPADFKGIKFRSAVAPMFIKLFETLDSSAVPIAATELFTALQQGTVDGQENPLTNIEAMNLHEVQKYVTLTGHVYVSSPVVINHDLWNSYSDEVRNILTTEFTTSRDNERQLNAEMTEKAVESLQSKGMEFNELTNHSEFVQALQPVWDYYISENGQSGQALIDAATK